MSTLTSITVSPSNPYILISYTQQFTAIAHFSDAPDLDITNNISTTWSVPLGQSVATINSVGLATAGIIAGYVIISAAYGGLIGTARLRVGLANYVRIFEEVVESIKVTETPLNAAHNPISKLTVPNFSSLCGGVTFVNSSGSSGGKNIGWSIVSGHPGDFAKQYISNEEQYDGYWVQQNASGLATTVFNVSQKNLGVVNSIPIDANGNQYTTSGVPVLVQFFGEAYVYTTDATIINGSFLGPDINGAVRKIPFNPALPTPILGYALESYANTYPNKVLMRIQICGE